MTTDFVMKPLNSGEIGISALTERAQKARNLTAGHMITFRSRDDAMPYVQAAETEGFTFAGKEHLKP